MNETFEITEIKTQISMPEFVDKLEELIKFAPDIILISRKGRGKIICDMLEKRNCTFDSVVL